MAAVANVAPAFAVNLGASSSGVVSYTLAGGVAWTLQALAFTVDLTASATNDDVFVRILSQNGVLLVGEVPGSSQTAGTTVAYTLAANLNPCDSITSGFLNLTPDTFATLMLAEGCQIEISARVETTGTADASAKITNAVAWAEGAPAGPLSDEIPLLTPLSILG